MYYRAWDLPASKEVKRVRENLERKMEEPSREDMYQKRKMDRWDLQRPPDVHV